MYRILVTCILLLLTMAALAFAADINGNWKGSVQGPDGSMEMTFTFKADGENVSGAISTPMGEMPLAGKIKGDDFNFSVSFEGMSLDHQCRVAGDSMYVNAPGMDGNPMQMILLRDKTAK